MNGRPELSLDGVPLPAPAENGLNITRNKIWSSNAGRNSATGDFKGDLVTMKYSVSATYENLAEADMLRFWEIAESAAPFHVLEFTLHEKKRRISCYIPEPTFPVKKWNPRTHETMYEGFTIEFIEK